MNDPGNGSGPARGAAPTTTKLIAEIGAERTTAGGHVYAVPFFDEISGTAQSIGVFQLSGPDGFNAGAFDELVANLDDYRLRSRRAS
jgi:hypothetical protein